ncbi:MAG: hydrolase [Novosphingobium sp.]
MQPLATAEAALVAGLDAAAMLAQVEAWSAIPSGTGNLPGLAAQAVALAHALAVLPGEPELIAPAPVQTIAADGSPVPQAHGHHLVLRVRPNAERRLLLTGHMDTVFGPDHPFQGVRRIDAETLSGPGVADMKGGLAVMIAALAAFEASPAAGAIGYDVLVNSDEEAGSPSSAALVAALARGKVAALTYEPALLPDGTLAGARGGSGNFSAVVTGRAAHAGRNPGWGRNAVVAAGDLALRLKAMESASFTANPARIDGGGANNVVPDHAVLRFNVRPGDEVDAERFSRAIYGLCREIELEHEVRVVLHGAMSRPPKPLTPASERLLGLVAQCGAALGQTIAWKPSGGVCDGNNIAAQGVPVVDTMGVRGGAIHSAEEYLSVASRAERAALSALVLHRLASGGAA